MAPGKRSREILDRALDAEKVARGRYELDPDTLECPICTEPLCPPVFQCLNGHTSCSSCSKKVVNRCPSCSLPIGTNRCIAMEKILESLQVRCKNAPYGCNEFLKFTARIDHETELSEHRPFRCPVPDCTYEGPKLTLPLHLESMHKVQTVELDSSRKMQFTMKSTDYLMLLRIGSELFVIHHEVMESLGDIFFCSSFGGIPDKLFYLKVELNNEAKYYIMRTGVRDIGRQEEWRNDFLLVPDAQVKSRAINLSV